MADLVQMQGIHKVFRVDGRPLRALDGIDLAVKEGESLGIVGESGCGKSTLARVLVGIEPPTHGEVTIGGLRVGARRRADRRRLAQLCQMIFQDPYASLNPRQRVGDIIEEPLIIHDAGERDRRQRKVRQLLHKVGLPPDSLERYPHQLSGGQRQRVGIARALALSPRVVVADEPVSALDVSVQAQVLNLLDELRREMELTLIMVSHDLQVVRWVSDRVAVMYLGRIVEIGPTAEVFARPLHPYTQLLLDAAPRIGAPLPDLSLTGDPPTALAPPPGCAFHPRCPMAQPHCARAAPILDGSRRRVACFEAPPPG